MKILFQGDSVTDAGRDRSNPHDMGDGYPRYASAMIQDSYPDTAFEFVNLGVGGDRTEQLVARLESDFIDVQPDVITIMIGINDVWHHYSHGIVTTDEAFEANLRTVLDAIRTRTQAKLLMIQPFMLFTHEWPADMVAELADKQAIFKRLADEYADAYLPMDDIFQKDAVEEPAFYSADGVHPTSDGACYIGEAVLRAIAPLLEASGAEED